MRGRPMATSDRLLGGARWTRLPRARERLVRVEWLPDGVPGLPRLHVSPAEATSDMHSDAAIS